MTQKEELEEEDLGLMKNVALKEWLIDHACVIVLNGGSNSQVTHSLFVAVHLRTGGC